MDPPRKTTDRWWVWTLVPLATVAGALSAFPEPAVRTTVGKLGAASRFEIEVRVWGIRLHRETVDATTTDPRAQALVQERRWRAVLATASASVSGGAAAALAAILFANMGKPPQLGPWHFAGITRGLPESDG